MPSLSLPAVRRSPPTISGSLPNQRKENDRALRPPHPGTDNLEGAPTLQPSEPEVPTRRIRTGTHREAAIKALKAWRLQMVRTKYKLTSFSEEAILSDEMIASLVCDATLNSVEDVIRRLADPPWVFAPRHAQDVLTVLANVDSAHDAAQASNLQSTTPRRSFRSTTLAVGPGNEENEDLLSPTSPSSTRAEIALPAVPRPKSRPRYLPHGIASLRGPTTTEPFT